MNISLDFHRNSVDERLEFLRDYVDNTAGFSPENLETMANYVLWADEKENGNNYQIESKKSPWAKQRNDLSYEGLVEQEQTTGAPMEGALLGGIAAKAKKAKLDRKDVVEKLWQKKDKNDNAEEQPDVRADPNQPSTTNTTTSSDIPDMRAHPSHSWTMSTSCPRIEDAATYRVNGFVFREEDWHPMANIWFDLWGQIDQTEYQVQSWELAHGKRRPDLPIREELHQRLEWLLWYMGSAQPLSQLEAKLEADSAKWDGYTYLKKKRSLVQMRTQQYSFLDCLGQDTLLHHMNMGMYWEEEERGISNFYPFMDRQLIFEEITEACFTKSFQDNCVRNLTYADTADRATGRVIDLRKPEVMRNLLLFQPDLADALPNLKIQDREVTESLLYFLKYYIDQCNFGEDLLYILNAKIGKMSNKDIAKAVKEKFNLSYKENYISTIFTRRIVEPIVEQVEKHYRLIEYITMGRTVFKKCSICGRLLPRNSTYFNKRTATSDGFFSYCKECKARRKS